MKDEKKQHPVEKIFELFLWNSRFIVLFAVLFSLLSSLILFVIASHSIGVIFIDIITECINGSVHVIEEKIIGTIIGAVDMYLIAVVLLIFGFGLYELFISEVDVAREDRHVSALEIHSLDELKNNITKVIIMVLVVSFFQRVLVMKFDTPLDMLYLAISIFALSSGLFLLYKQHHHKKNKDGE